GSSRTRREKAERAETPARQIVIIPVQDDMQNFVQQERLFLLFCSHAPLPVLRVTLPEITVVQDYFSCPDVFASLLIPENKCIRGQPAGEVSKLLIGRSRLAHNVAES